MPMISQRVTSVFGRNRSCGLMDKAPASGAGDSRFESVLDHCFLFGYFSFCAVCQQRQGFHSVQFIVLLLCGESARFAAPRRRSVRYCLLIFFGISLGRCLWSHSTKNSQLCHSISGDGSSTVRLNAPSLQHPGPCFLCYCDEDASSLLRCARPDDEAGNIVFLPAVLPTFVPPAGCEPARSG